MFIVTMIFLTGLIFAVQQLLLQYTFIDLSEPLQKNDIYLYRDIRTTVGSVMGGSSCSYALKELDEIHAFLRGLETRGYIIDLKYNGFSEPALNCQFWNTSTPVLALDVMITGPGTETSGTITYLSGDYAVPE